MKLPRIKFGKGRRNDDSEDEHLEEQDRPGESAKAIENEPAARGRGEDNSDAADELVAPVAKADDEDAAADGEDAGRGRARKIRLALLVASAIIAVTGVLGGTWWFIAGDVTEAPAVTPPQAASGIPRVVVEFPAGSGTPGGGLLTPPQPGAAASGQGPSTDAATPDTAPPTAAAAAPGEVQGRAAPGTLNAIATAASRESGTGIVVPAVTAQAYASLPAPPPSQPLPKAPDPALIEAGPQGTLPKVGADGRVAWKVYARPFSEADSKPRIAVVVTGLGLSRAATEAAVRNLPAEVTLAFAPYGVGIGDWAQVAREAGHEVLVSLPMEPDEFPVRDPGPLALLTSLAPADNVARLQAVLGRLAGYAGVISAAGARFSATETQIRPILERLSARGLLYVDASGSDASKVAAIAPEIGLPYAVARIVLDENPARGAIDARLTELEALARKQGRAVASISPFPVSLQRIVAWAATLEGKGLRLAPVSAAVAAAAASAAPAAKK